jgi:hypothetical protein
MKLAATKAVAVASLCRACRLLWRVDCCFSCFVVLASFISQSVSHRYSNRHSKFPLKAVESL